MTDRGSSAGITLLETLVALAIMGMVATILANGLGAVIKTLDRSAFVDADVRNAMARRDVRIWLEHALQNQPPDEARSVFQGNAQHVTFLTLPPGADFWLGVAVQVELDFNGSVTASGLDIEKRAPVSKSVQVAPENIELSFEFWGSRKAGESPAWGPDWPTGQGTPDLLKIEFTQGQRSLPPMVVRLAKASIQSEMSLSSLLPPALPSRP